MNFGRSRSTSHSAKESICNPKEIAAEIGKSERTVKSITIALQEKNILRRVNGKRNGYWEFVEDSIQQGSNTKQK